MAQLEQEAESPLQSPAVHPPGRSAPFSPSIVSGLGAMADGAVLLGSGLALYLLYVGWSDEGYPIYFSILALNTFLTLTAFYFADLYDFESLTRPAQQVKKILVICAITFMLIAALAFALKISAQLSRVWAFSWFLSAALLISLERTVSTVLLRKWARTGQVTRNIVVVGGGEQGVKLMGVLGRQGDPWSRVIGIFDERSDRTPREIGGIPVLGDLDDLIWFARENRIDDILVALPWSAEQRLLEILHRLKVLPVHIRLSPDKIGLNFLRHGFVHVGGIPALRVSEKPLVDWKFVLKAVEDRVLAAAILLLILPLMLVIAVAIKLDSSGPVLFRQKRYGFNNQFIKVLKFRTMYHDPNPDPSVPQANRNDPRVTRLGAFLRRSSLDELPQCLNVLKGEMSIVGPRPHAVAHDEKYAKMIDEYLSRHRVKPGITGWAQVNGRRGETDTIEKMEQRVAHDLHYIENWSLALDLEIILRTIWIVFRDKNAF